MFATHQLEGQNFLGSQFECHLKIEIERKKQEKLVECVHCPYSIQENIIMEFVELHAIPGRSNMTFEFQSPTILISEKR